MDHGNPSNFDDLLLQLLGFPRSEREDRLRLICHDPITRQKLRDLLGDRQQLRHHLGQMDSDSVTQVLVNRQFDDVTETLGAPRTPPPTHFMPPDAIGPFRILEPIGQGGMGVVYLAEQSEPVQRQLAIKLVHRNLRDPVSAARFEAERQAMARLSHPHIAQIFAAGTTVDGFPYFAMEYVANGLPITQFCDKHRLTIEERLELFLRVGRGVQHAHQRGIMHRDLKPSNILVAKAQGETVVKVIDFGLAKALDQPLTEDSQLTLGFLAGTPEYMGPEVFKNAEDPTDLDTRSDVYSLGIILYELLCGQRPFVTRGMHLLEKVKHILETEPPTPSRRLGTEPSLTQTDIAEHRRATVPVLRRRLAGELDFVVLKAIAQDREARYDSVADLNADLERHLRQEPVHAHPPSWPYRAQKFIRRHRTAVALGFLVLLTMVLGILGTTVGMVKANREADATRRALDEAEELAFFLTDLFKASEPGNPAQDLTAREILDVGAQRISEKLETQPQAKARILNTIGDIYIHLALYDQAETVLEQSLELRDQGQGPSSPGYAQALLSLGRLDYARDRFEESEASLTAALALFEAHGLTQYAAKAQFRLAATLRARGDLSRAEPFLWKSLALHEQAFGHDHPELVEVLNGLALFLNHVDRVQEAEEITQRALHIAEDQFGDEHLEVSRTLRILAQIYRDQGRMDKSLPIMERVLATEERFYGEVHPYVAQAVSELALHYHEGDRIDLAESYYRRSIDIFERTSGPESRDLSVALNNFGTFYWELGRYDEAEPLYRRSLRIKEKLFSPGHSSLANAYNNLGLIHWKRGQFTEAEEQLTRALEIWETNLGPDHRTVAWPLWGLAGVHRDRGDYDAAEPLYRRALDIRERALAAHSPELHQTRTDYAALLRATGRAAEAAELEAKNRPLPAQ